MLTKEKVVGVDLILVVRKTEIIVMIITGEMIEIVTILHVIEEMMTEIADMVEAPRKGARAFAGRDQDQEQGHHQKTQAGLRRNQMWLCSRVAKVLR